MEIIVALHGPNHQLSRFIDNGVWGLMTASAGVRDARLKIIQVPRKRTYPPTPLNHWLAGPVAPLNAALDAATGDWLARIDDDDQWTPTHLERLLEHARKNDCEFVSSAYLKRTSFSEEIIGGEGNPKIGGTQTWLWRSYLRFMRWNPQCWRKKWHRVNDTDLAERMRRAGVRCGYSPLITAIIEPRAGESEIGSKVYLGDPDKTMDRYKFD